MILAPLFILHFVRVSTAFTLPHATESIIASFGPMFDFGLATAPAHSEDSLDDSWLQWGVDGKIPFFLTVPQPERRLDFWSNPDVEINLAAETGVQTLRIGIDWGRLSPYEPGSMNCDVFGKVVRQQMFTNRTRYACRDGIQDDRALYHYLEIMEKVRYRDMKIMLTLFHHSLPKWANEKSFGGWTNKKTVPYFTAFVNDIIPHIAHLIDTYIVFNEAAVFVNLVYGMGMWPGRLSETFDGWAYWNSKIVKGAVVSAYENMALAHKLAYQIIHEKDTVIADKRFLSGTSFLENEPNTAAAIVGIAHNVAWYVPGPPVALNKVIAAFIDKMLNYDFMDRVASNLDFIGLNYYGKEFITSSGSAILQSHEYSESGRSISPDGLYRMIKIMNERYNSKMNRSIPIFITENGISDATDVLRPSYLIEHLLAVHQSIKDGIPLKAYIFWTISDNWEWADGYCPKFGLVNVDRRTDNLERTKRKSFDLYSSIVKSKNISVSQRDEYWLHVKTHKGMRPFCRTRDGKGTVSSPTQREFTNADWQFTKLK